MRSWQLKVLKWIFSIYVQLYVVLYIRNVAILFISHMAHNCHAYIIMCYILYQKRSHILKNKGVVKIPKDDLSGLLSLRCVKWYHTEPILFGQSLIGFKLQCVGRSLVLLSIQQENMWSYLRRMWFYLYFISAFLFYCHLFLSLLCKLKYLLKI